MARFFRRGISKVRFLPAVAGASPTRAELNAGTDLSASIAAIGGFTLENAPIGTPDLSTNFDNQVDGPDTAGASSFTFYDDDTATAVRNALAKGTAGYIVLMPYGDVATKRCEVWPVKSTGVNDQWGLDAAAAQFIIGFAITSKPNQNGTIPA